MILRRKNFFAIVLSLGMLLVGCSSSVSRPNAEEGTLKIVATTTMLADLAKVIGGDNVTVNGLMGPGIDPHLYQASAGDVTLMQEADIVIYNGFHLEGKMSEIFEKLSNQGPFVIGIENDIDRSKMLMSEDDAKVPDPHIWFNVSLWKEAARSVAKGISNADPDKAEVYGKNLEKYMEELDALDLYIRERTKELSQNQRVLITAHDAFQYFGEAYGFEVKGLQGISTDAEAGTSDVSQLADFIVNRQIKAVFIESSVPPKTIEALQAAVKAKGFDVKIGGELYSDSLGGEGSGADTYILTFKSNIDTIVDALK